MVVLNGPAMLKEALVNQGDSVADRPNLQLNIDASHGLGKEHNTQNHTKTPIYSVLNPVKPIHT